MVERPNNPTDKVRKLQRCLFTVAKRQKERRFHALYDRIWRGDVLAEAWKRVPILESHMLRDQIIGKPYAGNPHVRFDRGPQETELKRHRA